MFEKALKAALKKLRSAQQKGLLTDFVLIGGLAVSRWATPRATNDIDFAIQLDEADPQELADYLEGNYIRGALNDPLLGSISFQTKVAADNDVPVQLLQFPPAWEKAAFAHAAEQRLDQLKIPMIDWRSLVLLKLYAGSPLDLEDARRILEATRPSKAELVELKKRATALRVSRKLGRVLAP